MDDFELRNRAETYARELTREAGLPYNSDNQYGITIERAIQLMLVKLHDWQNRFGLYSHGAPDQNTMPLELRLLALEQRSEEAIVKVAEDRLKEVGLTFESVAHLELAELKKKLAEYEKRFGVLEMPVAGKVP